MAVYAEAGLLSAPAYSTQGITLGSAYAAPAIAHGPLISTPVLAHAAPTLIKAAPSVDYVVSTDSL